MFSTSVSKKFLLGCISASALAFSAPAWSEEADHDVIAGGDDDRIVVRPVIEYEFGAEGEFSTLGGNTGSFELEEGPSFGVDVSKDLGNGIRIEGNLRYSQTELAGVDYSKAYAPDGRMLSSAELAGLNKGTNVSGDVTRLTAGVSAWYEMDAGSDFKPYVGGGVHYVHATLDGVGVTAPGYSASYDDSDGAFGFTAGAGVRYDVSDSTTVHVGYRYNQTLQEQDFEGTAGGEDTVVTVDEFSSHAIMVGVGIAF